MRTISLFGISASFVLFLGLLAGNVPMMWLVFLSNIVGLFVLARNEDMLLFLQEHTFVAQLLEVAMYATAVTVVVLALNEYFFFAALTALLYGATWCVLLRYAPPFPGDFGMFDSIPENCRDHDL